MFCTESCEHGINATSSGRILGPKKSATPMEHQPAQMGQHQPEQQQQERQMQQQPHQQHHHQQQQLQQHQHQQHQQQQLQQQQQQQQQRQQRLRFAPQQPSCSMFSETLPPAELWMPNCNSAPHRMGTCIVTEGPEGLSIDCNVPIPNSFNLDGYSPQLLSFLATPGGNDNSSNNVDMTLPSSPIAAAADNRVLQHQLPKTVKQSKLERSRRKPSQPLQLTSSECNCYPTSYSAPPTEITPDANAVPPMAVMPVNQLLAYLSDVMCPPAANSTPQYPNPQQAPSCCHIQIHSLLPMPQQQQHLQQQQQQQQQPTFAAQPPALVRFELPCMLTGFTSGLVCPDQPQPPFALQLLSLPYASSMPSIPLPIPTAEGLHTSSNQTKLSHGLQPIVENCAPSPTPIPPSPPLKTPTASSPTYSLPCTSLEAESKKPIMINRKAGPRSSNIDAQYSYGRRPPFPLGNGNGNGCRNANRNGNANGNGNSCMSPPWHCPYCSHCCCHPRDHHQRI